MFGFGHTKQGATLPFLLLVLVVVDDVDVVAVAVMSFTAIITIGAVAVATKSVIIAILDHDHELTIITAAPTLGWGLLEARVEKTARDAHLDIARSARPSLPRPARSCHLGPSTTKAHYMKLAEHVCP